MLARTQTSCQVGVLLAALKSCKDLKQLKKLHLDAIASGVYSNVYIANTLVDRYGKLGNMASARKVFDMIIERTVVSWNALIMGYVENGKPVLGLALFAAMQTNGYVPTRATYLALLKACALLALDETPVKNDGEFVKVKSLEKGMAIHVGTDRAGYTSDVSVANTLVDMYANCASLVDAKRVFDRMSSHTVVSWTALLLGYAENGEGKLALEAFADMQQEGVLPNARTFVALLKACSSLAVEEEASQVDKKLVKTSLLEKAMALHSQACKARCDSDIFILNTLLDLYARCGSLEDAFILFDRMEVSDMHDTVSYNVMIIGLTQGDRNEEAFQLFAEMAQSSSEKQRQPIAQSFVAVLKACSNLAVKEQPSTADGKLVKMVSLEKCMAVHTHAVNTGFITSNFVENSLVDIYSKSGSMTDARRVFDEMKRRDVVSWTSLALGYIQNKEVDIGLAVFTTMEELGLQSDAQTYLVRLSACGAASLLNAGKSLHGKICRRGMENSPALQNCLIDVYAKCGNMPTSQLLFDSMPRTEIIGWNSLLGGYSRQSDTERVLDVVRSLEDESSVKPDRITLLCVLAAFSHAGCVDSGKEYLEKLSRRFAVQPDIDHYHCLIDMLGRANQVDAAVQAMKEMPFEAETVTLTTIMAACSNWKNVDVGRSVFTESFDVVASSPSAYTLLANCESFTSLSKDRNKSPEAC